MSQVGPLVATPVEKISVAKASAGVTNVAAFTKELRLSLKNKARKADENEVDNLRLMTIARSRRLINACMGKACGKNGPGKFGYFEPQHFTNLALMGQKRSFRVGSIPRMQLWQLFLSSTAHSVPERRAIPHRICASHMAHDTHRKVRLRQLRLSKHGILLHGLMVTNPYLSWDEVQM